MKRTQAAEYKKLNKELDNKITELGQYTFNILEARVNRETINETESRKANENYINYYIAKSEKIFKQIQEIKDEIRKL